LMVDARTGGVGEWLQPEHDRRIGARHGRLSYRLSGRALTPGDCRLRNSRRRTWFPGQREPSPVRALPGSDPFQAVDLCADGRLPPGGYSLGAAFPKSPRVCTSPSIAGEPRSK
jgi:hypothetical protein